MRDRRAKMEKLQSSFKNMVIVLLAITAIAAAALGTVYEATKEPIALAKAQKQEAAIKAVVPQFDNDPIAESQAYEVDGGIVKIFPAKQGDKAVGYAIETFTMNGFSGLIRIMVGIDTDNNIINFSVLEHKETPGLGSKMQEWFTNNGDIRGLNAKTNKLSVSKDGGDVDAITAATISSRAFFDAIQRGIKTFEDNAPGAEVAKELTPNEAINKIFAAYDIDDKIEASQPNADDKSLTAYAITKDAKPFGKAYQTITQRGYNGEIKIMIGTDLDGKIIDFIVLDHNETPGIGDKMQDWFSGEGSIIGQNIKDIKLKRDGGSIDAITGATITSQAFISAIQKINEL